jgi:CubicO group peptidase (beta-lactamase class C family)
MSIEVPATAAAMFYLLLLLSIGFELSVGTAKAFSWDAAKQRSVVQLVREFKARHKVPSVAVSVTVDGKTVLATGLDGQGAPDAAGATTRYNIGSVTKQFTAAAVLAMIEDREIVPHTKRPITLDTPAIDLFPHLDPQNDSAKITVRRLLTMTSNLPSYTDDDFQLKPDRSGAAPAARPMTVGEIIERLKNYKLTTPQGKFEYSNTNYFLLSLIIQVLKNGYEPTDRPIARDHIRQRIIARIGLNATGFVGDPLPSGAVAAPPNYLLPRYFDQGAWPRGAGDMVSTAADVAQWNVALMTGKVINRGLLRAMLAAAAPVTTSAAYSGCSYGMGWYVCNRPPHRLFQHDGVISGFMASNGIAQDRRDGSWMSATALANIDASIDIVELVRNILKAGAS